MISVPFSFPLLLDLFQYGFCSFVSLKLTLICISHRFLQGSIVRTASCTLPHNFVSLTQECLHEASNSHSIAQSEELFPCQPIIHLRASGPQPFYMCPGRLFETRVSVERVPAAGVPVMGHRKNSPRVCPQEISTLTKNFSFSYETFSWTTLPTSLGQLTGDFVNTVIHF